MKYPVWSRSIREEFLGVMYIIAGIQAWQADIAWLCWYTGFKAAECTVLTLRYAVLEIKDHKAAQARKDVTK